MRTCWAAPGQDQSKGITRPQTPGTSKNLINESVHSGSNGRTNQILTSQGPVGKIFEAPKMKGYKFAELKTATRNFKRDAVLGEGGLGKVYKGWVDDKTYAPSKPSIGIAVAVKRLNQKSVQGFEEWQREVNMLGRISHPNIIKLIGQCREDTELLLVYEFMQNGSLADHLFTKGFQLLSWVIRLKIALGAAHALTFLHASQVIYRGLSSSNILLDEKFNAKLSDFGLAKDGPANDDTHVSTRVMGTLGYAAPEYIATGHLSAKCDVYGFGVVLLEMLTGQRAIDRNCPDEERHLVDWTKPLLSNERKLMRIMDSRLNEQFPIKDAVQAAQLALKCLESNPINRPSMKQVVVALKQIPSTPFVLKKSKTSAMRPFI